jgi:hypothetical protein
MLERDLCDERHIDAWENREQRGDPDERDERRLDHAA